MPHKNARLANPVETELTAGMPAASQATTTRKHLRGKLGGLKDMPNMSMDILIEASGLLRPGDPMWRLCKDHPLLFRQRCDFAGLRAMIPVSVLTETSHTDIVSLATYGPLETRADHESLPDAAHEPKLRQPMESFQMASRRPSRSSSTSQ